MKASWSEVDFKFNPDAHLGEHILKDWQDIYVNKMGNEALLPPTETGSVPAPTPSVDLSSPVSRPPLETGLSLRWEVSVYQENSALRPAPAAANTAGKAKAGLYIPIRLDLVALHEFGHALGLAHYPDTPGDSIMEAYYNSNYNLGNFSGDLAIASRVDNYNNLLELYTSTTVNTNTSPWRQNADGTNNTRIDLSYSFVPDGTALEGGKTSSLYAVFNALFGANQWQTIFSDQLTNWANVSGGLIAFTERFDQGTASGSGSAQNDSRFGDIRIGSHKFDGAGGTLAHTYYPPNNNNSSIAGDAHFASEESWININGAAVLSSGTMVGSSTQVQLTGSGQIVYHCLQDHFG